MSEVGPGSRSRVADILNELSGELILPPVRDSLSDLAAGLERVCLVHGTLRTHAEVADLIAVADAVCDPRIADGACLVRLPGWTAAAVTGGPIGTIAVTPAAAAFGARCDAGWLARYCKARGRGWTRLGILATSVERLLDDLSEQLRGPDDDRAEREDDTDPDGTTADATVEHQRQLRARLAVLRNEPIRVAALAAGCRLRTDRDGTRRTLGALRDRLDFAARLMAQADSVRVATVRSLAYSEADQLVIDSSLDDLWTDLRGAEPKPTPHVAAEAFVVAALRDGALESLLAAAHRMGVRVRMD